MKIKQLLLIGLLFNLNGFSQTEVKVRHIEAKLDPKTEMLIPIENGKYLYEKYSYFKGVYWLMNQEVMTQKSDTIYFGSSLSINMNNNFVFKNPCDTLVNYIRNSSLNHRISSMLSDTASVYIGYDNEEFKNQQNEKPLTKKDKFLLCHNAFQELNKKWFNQQLELIRSIKLKKEKRLEWIINSDSIDLHFISAFLLDFNRCQIDYSAFIELVSKNADGFLYVCDKMSDTDFFNLILKLTYFPKSLKTDLAINSLKNSKTKTFRKHKIIRKLKKKITVRQ
jgi:hypothetical protein